MQKQVKTARGRRNLKRREPKVHENPKKGMFIKGHKTSQIVTDMMNDLYTLKKPHALKYNKKKSNSESGPFDDVSHVEFFSTKSDSSLFVYGSHSKKRPHNIVLGRLYDYHMLDMMEFGITNYKSMNSFSPSTLPMLGSKPCFTIIGQEFQNEEKYSIAANLIVDFFRGEIVDNINLKGLEHVVALGVGSEGSILFRQYLIKMKKSGTRVPIVELEEIGPSVDFTFRRHQYGAKALRDDSLKTPKELKPKKKKNITTNVFHDKVGTVHVAPQNLDQIHDKTRKQKALRKRKASEISDGGSETNSNIKSEEGTNTNKKLKPQ